MTNYLNTQPPAYNRFINNQVLTESQLNALLNHLNYQDKATRAMLIGVGIVCGLEVTASSNGRRVRLSKGVGITSDGDMISLINTDYTAFKAFEDTNVRYPHFIRSNKTIPLWELRDSDDASDVHQLDRFSSTAGFELNRAVALLYLEYYYRDPEDCSPADCNSQGQEIVARPRLLLVSENDAEFILTRDSILSAYPDKHSPKTRQLLEPLYVQRVVHSNRGSGERDLREAYRISFDEISNRLDELATLPLLKEVMTAEKVNHKQRLRSIAADDSHFQYRYGFYKDLAEALNELVRLLQKNITICSPDISAFPKHLMLGTLRTEAKPYRHRFYPSPALQHPAATWSIQKAYRRMLLMVRDYRAGVAKEVRVTPSRPFHKPIGKRAVPVYFDLQSSDDAAGFLDNWKNENTQPVLNYYGSGYPATFKPLDLYLKGHDFYRVEGHIGQPLFNVMQHLKKIKRDKGLAFKILPVAIGRQVDERSIELDDYKSYFEDLQVVLQAWNEEQQCLMKSASRFLSGFSLEEPGKHANFGELEVRFDTAAETLHTTRSILDAQRFMHHEPAKEAKVSNVVIDGFTKKKGTIGDILNRNVKYSDTSNDIRANYREWFGGRLDQIDTSLVDIIVRQPVELIGFMKETEDRKITDIRDFTPENLKRYIESLEQQCSRFKKALVDVQKALSQPNEKLSSAEWMGSYMQMMHRLSESCCLAEKVKVLYNTIIQRKEELFSQFRLDSFIEKHPGAEHLAGVPKGGTFILLYSSGRGIIRLNDGQVIGDLCLPYLCCSGTPSATFVIPEEKVSLGLPVHHVCRETDDEASEIRLDVTPRSGEVKAFIGEVQIEDAITQNDAGTFFNPNLVEPGDFGKAIRFTVNDQPTHPTLVVVEKPEPRFAITENIRFDNENTSAIVTFINQTANRANLNFEWDFGDNSIDASNEQQFEKLYQVQPGSEISLTVTLSASNDYCSGIHSDTIRITVPEFEREEPEPEPVPEPEPEPRPEPEPEPDPVIHCRDFASEKLKMSLDRLDRVFRSIPANQRVRQQLHELHHTHLTPFYHSILEDLQPVLRGQRDEEIAKMIESVQNFTLGNPQSFTHINAQRYATLLFIEMILLYLYPQACRENRINVLKVRDHRTLTHVGHINWTAATAELTEMFTNAIRNNVRDLNLIQIFEEANEFFSTRYSSELRRVMSRIPVIFTQL